MGETISDFLELVNELQKSINSETKQAEINESFAKLKEKGQEIEKDLKKVIKNLEVKTDASQITHQSQRAEEVYETAIEIPTENTPLLGK